MEVKWETILREYFLFFSSLQSLTPDFTVGVFLMLGSHCVLEEE